VTVEIKSTNLIIMIVLVLDYSKDSEIPRRQIKLMIVE
jgi:hypothetical protein